MSFDERKTLQGTAVTANGEETPGEDNGSGQSLAHEPGQSQVPLQPDQPHAQPGQQPGMAPQPGVPQQPAIAYDGDATAQPAGKGATVAGAPNHTTTIPIETLSGKFIRISLWRAFRLQIHSHEVLRSERKTLAIEAPHVVDPEQQAFLAWRRSVLLLVAIAFVPLTVLRFVEAFQGPSLPISAQVFLLFPALAEGAFCFIAFDQLKNWTKWQQQRRVLFIAWAIFMLAPFIVYLYPFRSEFSSFKIARQFTGWGGFGFKLTRANLEMSVGFVFGVKALIALGPKVVSLMPGLIRASVVSKLLFPGTSAPGWLMILAAPLYALFAYIIVLLPYQITGSWYFVAGNAGLMLAQIFIAWSGQVFTTPLDAADAQHRINRAWLAYILLMVVSAGFIFFGLYEFIMLLNLGIIRVFSSALSILSNVLLLTLIFTDGIVGGMIYFRKRVFPDPRREQLLRDSEEKLDRFST